MSLLQNAKLLKEAAGNLFEFSNMTLAELWAHGRDDAMHKAVSLNMHLAVIERYGEEDAIEALHAIPR